MLELNSSVGMKEQKTQKLSVVNFNSSKEHSVNIRKKRKKEEEEKKKVKYFQEAWMLPKYFLAEFQSQPVPSVRKNFKNFSPLFYIKYI